MTAIVLFGGGRMGSALLRGWTASGISPAGITVVDPAPSEDLLAFGRQAGFAVNAPVEASAGQTLLVAVKPQKVSELSSIQALIRDDTLIISIMAGKTVSDLHRLFVGAKSVVRAMPNLPAAVGRGATVAYAACSPAQKDVAARLLQCCGSLDWLSEERLIDVATGVSGSGPAYLFYLADCLTEAGIAAGLPATVAERLARATVTGAGEVLHQSPKTAAELRDEVTSPGGTTQAGLRILMRDKVLQDLMIGTVAAAVDRSRELAG